MKFRFWVPILPALTGNRRFALSIDLIANIEHFTDKSLVQKAALFHTSDREAGWTLHPPIRSGPRGSSRSGPRTGHPVFR